jgi:hypothetical protein
LGELKLEKKERKTEKVAKESTILITLEKLEEEIRRRAREIFLARGDASGDALADWLRAEKEIKKKYELS